jgi:GT2 family glycosyltransferase
VIDVVIPVYGQVDLALRCIKSVLKSKNRVPFQLIVIDDGSPDPKVFRSLKAYAKRRAINLLRNSENLGFPATCNRAFALNPTNDVVLLNSDTVVFGDWLDRLHEVAMSDPAVGTVTPFTNSGTHAPPTRVHTSAARNHGFAQPARRKSHVWYLRNLFRIRR